MHYPINFQIYVELTFRIFFFFFFFKALWSLWLTQECFQNFFYACRVLMYWTHRLCIRNRPGWWVQNFLSISSPWPFCADDLCCALLIGLVQDVLVKLNLFCMFGAWHLMASKVELSFGELMHRCKCAPVFRNIFITEVGPSAFPHLCILCQFCVITGEYFYIKF